MARDLYLRAVDEDPRYAPAWARLARIYLLLGKYGGDSSRDYVLAESAARRALDLNPDLATAHYAYAQLEASTGRAQASMLRLLDLVQRGTNDPAVFAALVTVCRFCGLLEASAAAHEQAKQLDPQASTSAAHTYWMMGRYEEALAAVDPDRDFGDEAFIHVSRGDIDKAVAVFADRKRRLALTGAKPAAFGFRVFDAFNAAILGQRELLVAMYEGLRDFPDPEGLYYMARAMAHVGEIEIALDNFERSQQTGFFCFPFYMHDAWLDPLRGEPRFTEAVREAETQWRAARRAFDEHPGSRVLRVGV